MTRGLPRPDPRTTAAATASGAAATRGGRFAAALRRLAARGAGASGSNPCRVAWRLGVAARRASGG